MLISPDTEIPDYVWNYLYAYAGYSKEHVQSTLGKARV